MESTTNPENLTKRQVLDLIKYCPVCATDWPEGKLECENEECGVKLRVEPRATNWWMFYPKCNGWGQLESEVLGEQNDSVSQREENEGLLGM